MFALRPVMAGRIILSFAVPIFLSAFLLFQVQLLLAKFILPWYGGAASVWTACMLFFQTLLLIGYSYAHWLAQRPRLATQGRIHLLALSVAAGALILTSLAWGTPLLADGSWKPGPDSVPIWHILMLLCVTVGLPYLVLSATGPLLQAWFSVREPGRSPYRLYALSNLGSLLGLLTYPFLFEIFVPLRAQTLVWTSGYAIFTAGMGWRAWRLASTGSNVPSTSVRGIDDAASRPAKRDVLLWFALPACASVLLLASTNQMSQEIAVNPFLWVLPLCLYLASFILCFDSDRWYWRELYLFLLVPALALATLILVGGERAPVLAQIGILSAALFIVCMLCHGELVRLKPAPRHLTAFYLTLTASGAAGGLFVGLLAPALFTGFFELPIALWFTAALLFGVLRRDRGSPLYRLPATAAYGVLAASLLLAGFVFGAELPERSWSLPDHFLAAPRLATGIVSITLVLAASAGWLYWRRSARVHTVWPVWMACLLVFGISQIGVAYAPLADAALTARNFYGVVQLLVQAETDTDVTILKLRHGRILHGLQVMDEARRHEPYAYYYQRSGIGLAILHHPRRRRAETLHIGVIGLGSGILAAYGHAGDHIRFYEINPHVIRLAAAPRAPFTYVRDSAATIRVVTGDARLALEAELLRSGPQGFDVLAVDAFNSDSIPVHLLTLEALTLYFNHLGPQGILALHVSNRYLDLVPVVTRLAQALDVDYRVIETTAHDREWAATWVLLARARDILATPAIDAAAVVQPPAPAPLWRDDFSNLFQALRHTPSTGANPLADL